MCGGGGLTYAAEIFKPSVRQQSTSAGEKHGNDQRPKSGLNCTFKSFMFLCFLCFGDAKTSSHYDGQ